MTTEAWLGLAGAAAVPWLLFALAMAIARREAHQTRDDQTRVIVGRSAVLPWLVGVWLMLGPVLLFMQGAEALAWSTAEPVAPALAAGLLLVLAGVLLFSCLRIIPRLRLSRRVVVDDEGIVLRWWWRESPRFVLRWDRPYRHEVFLDREEKQRKDGGSYALSYENHRFEQDGEVLWLRMAEGEPRLNAVEIPEDAPRWRPTLAMPRERARFLRDARIANRRRAWVPDAAELSTGRDAPTLHSKSG